MSGALGSTTAMLSVTHGTLAPTILPFSGKQLPVGLHSNANSNLNRFFSRSLHGSSFYSAPCKRVVTAAADANQLSYADPVDEKSQKKYYFVVANAKFMLDEEEHFKEQLFERLRYFGERNLEQDFWLVIEPKFLDKFPNITKRLRRPAVALVSTNGTWITFMKLRLDRVLTESFEADSLEEALASTPTEIQFDKPEKWVAPYTKYEYGWWEAFLPSGSNESKA